MVRNNLECCDLCGSKAIALTVTDITAHANGHFLPLYPRRAYCVKCAEKLGDKAYARVYREPEVVRW